ncbi:hypothetical protein MF672_023655 [Actinomadura sp. ATCC 31491]|uniref:Uncharacterized protein n=1 Tax=Actinomadura luzonensis TaxID=2805427 RepID=A0ABT0FWQ4_9ACTN|nr:hypothetical protein [Actinomadura luzonensis]MCK2216773.1 hypothetical protein [Actinomadura luzonensis]
MTDPITCPECQGRRGRRFGPLFLACPFCGGTGRVGGADEPAERGCEPPPEGPPPAWQHKVWQDPWTAAALGCRLCLGSRRLSHVDREAGRLVTMPCPCATGDEPDLPWPA